VIRSISSSVSVSVLRFVKFGRPRRLVTGDLRRLFERAIVLPVGRDSGRPEGVVARTVRHAAGIGAPFDDDPVDIRLAEPSVSISGAGLITGVSLSGPQRHLAMMVTARGR
jgi:hypothetical protein